MAEELEGRLYELANHTQRVEDMVREVAHLQNTANSSPFRGIIAQSEELKLQSEALQKEARELLRACQDYYPDAENAYEGLRENSARLRDMVDQLQTFLEKLSPATEKAVPYVREAEIHSHKLQQQARECQTILNSTQQTSSSALAYDEIAKIIDEAQNISEAALATSNEAHDNILGTAGNPTADHWTPAQLQTDAAFPCVSFLLLHEALASVPLFLKDQHEKVHLLAGGLFFLGGFSCGFSGRSTVSFTSCNSSGELSSSSR
ncbi:uncharacterized protein LOC121834161 isoform X2 [Ixodes scapularis]|nr:uncharacterized protein LOC121834161 isoform X2 [Ixodes scapularis]